MIKLHSVIIVDEDDATTVRLGHRRQIRIYQINQNWKVNEGAGDLCAVNGDGFAINPTVVRARSFRSLGNKKGGDSFVAVHRQEIRVI